MLCANVTSQMLLSFGFLQTDFHCILVKSISFGDIVVFANQLTFIYSVAGPGAKLCLDFILFFLVYTTKSHFNNIIIETRYASFLVIFIESSVLCLI